MGILVYPLLWVSAGCISPTVGPLKGSMCRAPFKELEGTLQGGLLEEPFRVL